MFKLICVFVFYIAAGYAVDKKAEITSGKLEKGIDYPGVTIESSGKKTDITWNKGVSAQTFPLRATFDLHFKKSNKRESSDLKNLCGDYEKGSPDYFSQIYILNTIANVDSCPIKKGAKATFSVPKTISYSIDEALECGEYTGDFKVFKKSSTDNAHPIMTNTFQGKITGC